MRKLLLGALISSISFVSFAESIERTIRQIGPTTLLAASVGSIILFIGIILSYVAVSYGIYLLAKKYEPSLHTAWSWIPFVNIYPLVKVSRQSLWWIAVLLLAGMVPFIGPIIAIGAAIFIYLKISERAGRGGGTTALLLFFSVITLPWLGLSVNKRNTNPAWILGICAMALTLIGLALAGAGAVGGLLHLNRTHNFMDKTRAEIMQEIQKNPTMRDQIKEMQEQMNKSDDSTKVKVNATTTTAE